MSGLKFEMSCCFEVTPEVPSKLEILGYNRKYKPHSL